VGKLALVALLSGCFGYNSSAKHWAYFGDSLLLAGGGAAIALGVTDKTDCTTTGASCYSSSINGSMVAGTMLVAAGIVGIIYNATRAEVKLSR
jgi:hypothetical protein